jgi:hypothetical protein
MKKLTLTFLPLLLASPSLLADSLSPFYVGAYGGYGKVDGAYESDGDFAQGRFALGAYAAVVNRFSLGLETGVQTGNTQRLQTSPANVDMAGGLPVQSTLKSPVDLLITARTQLLPCHPLFAILKGGIAYRQLQFDDRTSPQDTLKKINPEFQAGLGYNITEHAMVTAYYQGIYSSGSSNLKLSPYTTTDEFGDVDTFYNVTINRIPTQNAGFLGLEYSF